MMEVVASDYKVAKGQAWRRKSDKEEDYGGIQQAEEEEDEG
jgi:hypothetical protein